MSIMFSVSTKSSLPRAERRPRTCVCSLSLTATVHVHAVMPAPICEGVFGIARTTLAVPTVAAVNFRQTQTGGAQLSYVKEGVVDLIREEDLRKTLDQSEKTGKPLRVKLGVDPTSPDIHLGHTVVVRKLKAFHDHGHTAIY